MISTAGRSVETTTLSRHESLARLCACGVPRARSCCPHSFLRPYRGCGHGCGWRLSNDGFPNHTDVLEGVAHVQDFKRASPSKLSRVITFRFRTQRIACEGDLMRIEEFVARCQSEPAFLRAAKALPRYEHWIRQLCAKLPEVPRSLQASEPDAHDRTLVVPMHGRPDWVRRFAQQYEDGF